MSTDSLTPLTELPVLQGFSSTRALLHPFALISLSSLFRPSLPDLRPLDALYHLPPTPSSSQVSSALASFAGVLDRTVENAKTSKLPTNLVASIATAYLQGLSAALTFIEDDKIFRCATTCLDGVFFARPHLDDASRQTIDRDILASIIPNGSPPSTSGVSQLVARARTLLTSLSSHSNLHSPSIDPQVAVRILDLLTAYSSHLERQAHDFPPPTAKSPARKSRAKGEDDVWGTDLGALSYARCMRVSMEVRCLVGEIAMGLASRDVEGVKLRAGAGATTTAAETEAFSDPQTHGQDEEAVEDDEPVAKAEGKGKRRASRRPPAKQRDDDSPDTKSTLISGRPAQSPATHGRTVSRKSESKPRKRARSSSSSTDSIVILSALPSEPAPARTNHSDENPGTRWEDLAESTLLRLLVDARHLTEDSHHLLLSSRVESVRWLGEDSHSPSQLEVDDPESNEVDSDSESDSESDSDPDPESDSDPDAELGYACPLRTVFRLYESHEELRLAVWLDLPPGARGRMGAYIRGEDQRVGQAWDELGLVLLGKFSTATLAELGLSGDKLDQWAGIAAARKTKTSRRVKKGRKTV